MTKKLILGKAEIIVRNDDLSARIDVDAVDEIVILTEEFNKMIERLAEARQPRLGR